jgi:hypothetical protein
MLHVGQMDLQNDGNIVPFPPKPFTNDLFHAIDDSLCIMYYVVMFHP